MARKIYLANYLENFSQDVFNAKTLRRKGRKGNLKEQNKKVIRIAFQFLKNLCGFASLCPCVNDLFQTNKTISDTHNCFDTIPAIAKFLPQTANVNVERARVAKVTVTPNIVE